jgi:hypothetical protein
MLILAADSGIKSTTGHSDKNHDGSLPPHAPAQQKTFLPLSRKRLTRCPPPKQTAMTQPVLVHSPNIEPAMVRLLHHPDQGVRYRALNVLSRLTNPTLYTPRGSYEPSNPYAGGAYQAGSV